MTWIKIRERQLKIGDKKMKKEEYTVRGLGFRIPVIYNKEEALKTYKGLKEKYPSDKIQVILYACEMSEVTDNFDILLLI